jgi:ribosomal protein S18 acetylase RimI-like enzyme
MSADYAELIRRRMVYVLQPLQPPHDQRIRAIIVLRADAEALWIDNVAVHPQYQHRGYGRRLMQFAERHARAAGLPEIRLYTHELMVENISLYTHLGYVEFDRRLDDGFRRVFMNKNVSSARSRPTRW